jgi:8-oxo-dGTP diphosphatase
MRRISKAIFYNKDKFLIQQRDSHLNKYPNIWTLFGGNINNNESPEECLKREMLEELNYQIHDVKLLFTKIRNQDRQDVEDNIFAGEIGLDVLEHELLEGQNMKLVTIEELDSYEIFPAFKKYIIDFF